MIQLDLTNAYLQAPIVDVVYIIVPEGFEGAGKIARLRKRHMELNKEHDDSTTILHSLSQKSI
jgi:hypothetical protein